jgi:hypothetical protein
MKMRHAAVALVAGGSGGVGREAIAMASRYDEFIVRARTLGMTTEQATAIFKTEIGVCDGFDAAMRRCDERWNQFAEYGYLPMVLSDLLTWDEIKDLPFGSGTPLNDWRWMQRPLGRQFAEMGHDRQRVLVEAAIELTTQLGGEKEGWSLERAIAAVMPAQPDGLAC